MKNRLLILLIVTLLVPFTLHVQAQDEEPQLKDTPWLSRMPNFEIYSAEDIEFESYNFFNGKNCTTVEGKVFKRRYTLKEGGQQSSILQISRNYANAIRSMGGTVIYEGEPQDAECAENNGRHMVIGKVAKDGNELWIEIVPFGGDDYFMTIALKELMKQDVTASSMFEALNRDGHIAFTSILTSVNQI